MSVTRSTLLAVALLATSSAFAQNAKVSQLIPATLPLTGTELFYVVQGGVSKQTTAAAVGAGGAVNSVTNSDGTLTIIPTTGAVVASLALGHANTWTGLMTASGGLVVSGTPSITQSWSGASNLVSLNSNVTAASATLNEASALIRMTSALGGGASAYKIALGTEMIMNAGSGNGYALNSVVTINSGVGTHSGYALESDLTNFNVDYPLPNQSGYLGVTSNGHAIAAGSNTFPASAAIYMGALSPATFGWHAGLYMFGSNLIKDYSVYDGTNSITSYFDAGAHTVGIELFGSYSANAIQGNGFAISGAGASSFASLSISGITGSTQCLEIGSTGAVSGTGAPCGSGSGAVNSVSNSDGTLSIPTTTGTVVASLALGHANTWTAAQTFSAGLTGTLTGGASLDLPLAGGALTGAVTQILASGGVFTADGSQFLSQTTATTAVTIYHTVVPSTYLFFDVNRSTLVLNSGTTVQNADGYGVYILNNKVEGTSPNQGNAVGFFSLAVAQATNSQTFGGNFAWNDNGVTATGVGLENDISISGTGSTGVGFSAELQGNGTLSGLGALGFGCDANQATSLRWSSCFSTTDGGATIGMLLGALLRTGANNASQPLDFHASNGSSTIYTGTIQVSGDAFAFTDSEKACGLGEFLSALGVTIQPINCSGAMTLAASSILIGASLGITPTFQSANPANSAVYSNLANIANGYTTIYNGAQFSLGTPIPASGQFGQNTVGIQQALVATLSIASGDTAGNAGFALAGYGKNNATGTGVVGVGAFGMCAVSACAEVDGVNEVVSNAATLQAASGNNFALIVGNQVNINMEPVSGSPPTGVLYGYYLVGGGNSTGNQGLGFVVDQLSVSTSAKWLTGFETYNGCCVAGVSIGTLSGTEGTPVANSGSQPLVFNATNASVVNLQSTIAEDANGNLILNPTSGAEIALEDGAGHILSSFSNVGGATITFSSSLPSSGGTKYLCLNGSNQVTAQTAAC